jgi:hypothetical protein
MLFSLAHAAVRAATDVFIGAMLFWMVFYDAEMANPVRRHFIPRLEPLFAWLGLHANWTMFAPDPPARTIWPKVRMTAANGDVVEWEPTPPARLGVAGRIRFKKFYKFYHDVARPGAAYHTKRDFVEYLLRRGLHPQPCVRAEVFAVYTRTPPFPGEEREEAVYKSSVFAFHPETPRGAS